MMTSVVLAGRTFTVRQFNPKPPVIDPVMAAATVAVQAWRDLLTTEDYGAVDRAMSALEAVLG